MISTLWHWLLWFIDFLLHLDKHLGELIARNGNFTYAILVAIIFCETGLVVTPVLPGDSLLFAIGAFSAQGHLNVWLCLVLLTLAAIVGDAVNYSIGRRMGEKVFTQNFRFIRREHLLRTQAFFEKYGGKTIIFARFVPIVRTFAPFLAGVGKMPYSRFALFNVVGGVVWVVLFIAAGYAFGDIPLVRKNFTLVMFAIIIISVLPAAVEAWRGYRSNRVSQS